MNSHIVEKTMHSIKNIDRLTDLAAIDVYNTTHDTINKYEIMKEHATEEYTNESFYQESVLAGVLIGAGILGVAVSAFFIIKKIIDSKSQVTTKNSDGSTSVAVDLSDPKSTEKFITKLKERASKLNADTKVTTSQSINPEAAEKEIAILEEVVQKFQEIIDNKDDTAKIKSILSGLKTDTDFNQLTNQAFVSGNKEITLGNYVEELGIGEMVNFSKKINELKTKCDKAEKTINGMKANKETDSSTEGITDAEIKSLKDFSTLVAKALDSMLNKSNAMCSSANTILDQAEEDAKKPKEEAKPETSEAKKKDESAENSADTGAAENKNKTDESKPEVQPTADTKAGAGGNDNTGKQSSTLENVMGPGGQTEQTKQASEAKEAAEALNKNVLYLNQKGDTQKDATGKQVIPAAAEARANEKTLEDVINMLKSGKSEEEIRDQLTLNNYKADQIDAFLTEAKNKITNERKSELLNQTLGGTKPKVLEGEVLPSDTEAKPFKFPKAEDNTFNNNRREQGIDKVVENIRRLVPADSEEGSWDKIVPTLKTYGFTDKEINDYAVRNNIIPSESQDTLAPTPTEPPATEESDYPADAELNNRPELKKELIDAMAGYMKRYPDLSDDEVFRVGKMNTLKISPEMAKELKTSARELANKGSSENVPTETEESETKNPSEPETKPEDQVKTEPENPSVPTDQNTSENAQETTPETSIEEPETKSEGEDKNSPADEETENSGEKKWTVSKIIELAKSKSDNAFELLSAIKNDDIENDVVPKKTFETGLMDAAAVMALPMDYKTRLLTTFESNNSLLGTIKSIINEIKNGDRSAVNKLKNINVNDELTTGNDVSDFITSIIPRVTSAFNSIIAKYNTPEMKEKRAQDISNIEQNVATFFNFIKEACAGLFNKDKALAKVNELEAVVEGKMHHLDPNYSGKREGLPNYGSNGKSVNIGGHTPTEQTSGLIGKVPENEINRQQRQLESLSNNKIQAPAQFNPSAPADWNDHMEALGKAGIPNKQVPEPKTAPTPLNPSAPQEWNDNMNALKSAGAENISQKTEVPPISPIDTNADIEKAKAEKAQLDALQQHRQEQLAQLKAERAQREQQVKNAYAQDAQARQNAINEELAKQSQENEQKKAQAGELTKANEEANITEAIRQAEEEKKALEEGKNLSVSPQSTEGLDNAAKAVAMQDFIKNFKDPAWREAHPGIVTWQDLYNSDGYKNEAIMKVEAERIKNEKLAANRAGIQFIKEQNYEAIVPSLNKALETTSDAKTITSYLDGLKTAYAKILMQYQQNPGNARKIIEDYSKNGAAPYEFYTVPYNELNQTQLIDWQQRLFGAKVELDKDRRRNRKEIKRIDKIIDKLIEMDELLKTSVHNVIATATKNPMRALEAALVMFQEGDEEIVAGLTAIENFISKADEVKASEEEADKTPENPAEEPSDEEVSQNILSILKS